MAETTTSALDRALAQLANDIDVPASPPLAGSVAARLGAERAAGARRVLPGRALWTPRMRLVAATLALLAVLAIAAGARYAIGAATIRVDPDVRPRGGPVEPASLGDPVALARLSAAVGFDVQAPTGRAPDAAYASAAGDGAAILAWRADERSPRLPGTPWGLILVEVAGGSDDILVKRVNTFEQTDEVVLDGEPAFWVHAPHELLVVTDEGDERFRVEGNVLIWEEDGITFRLETPLTLDAALDIAETVRPLGDGNALDGSGV